MAEEYSSFFDNRALLSDDIDLAELDAAAAAEEVTYALPDVDNYDLRQTYMHNLMFSFDRALPDSNWMCRWPGRALDRLLVREVIRPYAFGPYCCSREVMRVRSPYAVKHMSALTTIALDQDGDQIRKFATLRYNPPPDPAAKCEYTEYTHCECANCIEAKYTSVPSMQLYKDAYYHPDDAEYQHEICDMWDLPHYMPVHYTPGTPAEFMDTIVHLQLGRGESKYVCFWTEPGNVLCYCNTIGIRASELHWYRRTLHENGYSAIIKLGKASFVGQFLGVTPTGTLWREPREIVQYAAQSSITSSADSAPTK